MFLTDNDSVEDCSVVVNAQDIKEDLKFVWPDQFKTVLGKLVMLQGKQSSGEISLIKYSTSKLQGYAMANSKVEEVSFLLEQIESLYDEGFLEAEDGNDLDSLILPIDGFELTAPDCKGVIIDCDLRQYSKGYKWLLNLNDEVIRNNLNLEQVMKALHGFVKTICHLKAKGYQISLLDGHQCYFNAEYGAFQFVFDGVNISKASEATNTLESEERLEQAVSSVLLYLLTGIWRIGHNSLLDGFEEADENALNWNADLEEASGSQAAVGAWNSLPKAIRDTLVKACLQAPVEKVTLEEWEQLLSAEKCKVETCSHCGNNLFVSALNCAFCGNSTDKQDLLTKWLIQDFSTNLFLKISVGRGVALAGEILGIKTNSSPYFKIMYNSKVNCLGVKNLSSIKWSSSIEGVAEEILPGKIVKIEKGLEISFEGHPDLSMTFLGYEVK